jgi:hypothetical protein
MIKSRESKMLDEIRQWRRKAYDADKAKPPAKRTEEAEELARKLDLPVAQTHRADADER